MAAIPRCSEYVTGCQNRLINQATGKRSPAGTKTCSKKCRDSRARRLKREAKAASERAKKNFALPEHLQPVADAVAGRVADAAHEVYKEEIRPIVRDALTADVLAGLGDIVNLLPDAIEAIKSDIRVEIDGVDLSGLDGAFDRRQRAYTLLLKYTAGNATIAPLPQEQAAAPMQVIFAMPRPGDGPLKPPATIDSEVIELRDCVECEATKPAAEFVGSSQRCDTCQQKLEDMVNARFSS